MWTDIKQKRLVCAWVSAPVEKRPQWRHFAARSAIKCKDPETGFRRQLDIYGIMLCYKKAPPSLKLSNLSLLTPMGEFTEQFLQLFARTSVPDQVWFLEVIVCYWKQTYCIISGRTLWFESCSIQLFWSSPIMDYPSRWVECFYLYRFIVSFNW